jgi:N-acetyl-gamma-glutamyl-phosphate reductase
MIRCAILGASGYVGGEILRLLSRHPDLRPARLFGDSKAGMAAHVVHPQLGGATTKLSVERFTPEALDGTDLVFAALPHGESQKLAGTILERGRKLVDLGADFRLRNAQDYGRWYGEEHQAPALLPRFVYGIPELHRAAIHDAQAVAAAGCYPTATILACWPLIEAGLVDPASLIVDAASGVSGAGRGLKEATAFNTVEGSFSAYGLLNHRHTAEMEQELGATVLFTPHLAPMARGILATCYFAATRDMEPDEPLEVLRAAYGNEPFVRVSDDAPATKWVSGSNGAVVTARYDARTRRVLALGAIDNLGKGAAGQMIQCANLMLGLDETAGLWAEGVFP